MDTKGVKLGAHVPAQLGTRAETAVQEKEDKQKSTTPELLGLSAPPQGAVMPRKPQTSALIRLSKDIRNCLFEFLAGEPRALTRLAATCRDMREALVPYVQHYTWHDRSKNAHSLERFQALLTYGADREGLFTSNGRLQLFRADLLATLGRRILALPSENRAEALTGFIAAAEGCDGQQTESLKSALDDAKKGLAHLQSAEQKAVERTLRECRTCADLAAVQELAARHGICSPEGLAEMKFAAACGKVSGQSKMSWAQARELFGIPFSKAQEQREYEYDVMLNWRDRFYE
jgi:hypothetical protein